MTGGEPLWQRNEAVLWRRSGTTVLLKTPCAPDIVALDGTGTALWGELERPATLPALADRLGERFDVAPEVVSADLLPVMRDLERRQLVLRRLE